MNQGRTEKWDKMIAQEFADYAADPPAGEKEKKNKTSAWKVLIVDDDDMVRHSVEKVLNYFFPALPLDMAANGREAVMLFEKNHYPVVVTDLNMPVMDGEQAYFQVMSLCASNHWPIPSFIFCSGYDPSDRIRGIVEQSPSHCFLHKPVSNQALVVEVLRRLMDASESRSQPSN